jgi:hypothetical protein
MKRIYLTPVSTLTRIGTTTDFDTKGKPLHLFVFWGTTVYERTA